jgi:hypothetical protein
MEEKLLESLLKKMKKWKNIKEEISITIPEKIRKNLP